VVSLSLTPPTLERDNFGERANTDLKVPIGSIDAYENGGWSGFKSITEIEPVIRVSLKAFLQGGATNPNTGEEALMRDDLRVAGNIPDTSPYEDALTAEASVFDTEGANAIVDWVFVELRDQNDNTLVLEGRSALLQRDGDIVATDGVSIPEFTNCPDGDYFITVNHRNHLGIITANTFTLSFIPTTIDLTNDPTLIEGGVNALVEASTGVFGLVGADFDADGQVLSTDITEVVSETGASGYSNADLDMNGQILSTDIIIGNQNIGRGEQFSTSPQME